MPETHCPGARVMWSRHTTVYGDTWTPTQSLSGPTALGALHPRTEGGSEHPSAGHRNHSWRAQRDQSGTARSVRGGGEQPQPGCCRVCPSETGRVAEVRGAGTGAQAMSSCWTAAGHRPVGRATTHSPASPHLCPGPTWMQSSLWSPSCWTRAYPASVARQSNS